MNLLGFKYDFPDILQPEVTPGGGNARVCSRLASRVVNIETKGDDTYSRSIWRHRLGLGVNFVLDANERPLTPGFVCTFTCTPPLFFRMQRATQLTVYWYTVCTSRAPRGITSPSDFATLDQTRCELQRQLYTFYPKLATSQIPVSKLGGHLLSSATLHRGSIAWQEHSRRSYWPGQC